MRLALRQIAFSALAKAAGKMGICPRRRRVQSADRRRNRNRQTDGECSRETDDEVAVGRQAGRLLDLP